MSDPRLRLFLLRDYFLRETDEAHTVTVAELIAFLDASGCPGVDRRTVYADVAHLKRCGMDIEKRRRGRVHHYDLASRAFELPELKLLVDAVQASRFITETKSAELIGKLESLTSRYQAVQLSRQVYVRDRVKAENESIYCSVDRIHAAIAKNRKICFQYCQYTIQKALEPRRGGEVYEVSPYLLAWSDDNYYLIADHPVHAGYAHFRVDKMLDVRLSEKARTRPASPLDPAAYARSMFSMYAGVCRTVTLRFDNSLIGAVIDRFGRDTVICPDGADAFCVRVQVTVSPAFFAWLTQFGKLASIVKPDSVRAEMKALLEASASQYEDVESMPLL